jgi:hypothetical protein
MFGNKDRTQVIYFSYDKARLEEVPLDTNYQFTPANKVINWEDLENQFRLTSAKLMKLAKSYVVAAEIIDELGLLRVKIAISKAQAICRDVDYEFEPDFEVVDFADMATLTKVEETYGKLNTMDRYILTGIGADELLSDAMEIIVAAYGNEGDE